MKLSRYLLDSLDALGIGACEYDEQMRALCWNRTFLQIFPEDDGEIYVGDNKVEAAALVERVRATATNGAEERIFVRGDAAANYQAIMDVLSQLKGGGFTKVALVATERASR